MGDGRCPTGPGEHAGPKLRTLVKRVLRKYGYPPDKQKKVTLAQAELLGKEWAAPENPEGVQRGIQTLDPEGIGLRGARVRQANTPPVVSLSP